MDKALVGTDATVVKIANRCEISCGWRNAIACAPLLFIIVLACFFAVDQQAYAQTGLNSVVEVRGNSVSRWKHGNADASLLEGDCVITVGGKQRNAGVVLLLADELSLIHI